MDFTLFFFEFLDYHLLLLAPVVLLCLSLPVQALYHISDISGFSLKLLSLLSLFCWFLQNLALNGLWVPTFQTTQVRERTPESWQPSLLGFLSLLRASELPSCTLFRPWLTNLGQQSFSYCACHGPPLSTAPLHILHCLDVFTGMVQQTIQRVLRASPELLSLLLPH